jgi:hypothetical protein
VQLNYFIDSIQLVRGDKRYFADTRTKLTGKIQINIFAGQAIHIHRNDKKVACG